MPALVAGALHDLRVDAMKPLQYPRVLFEVQLSNRKRESFHQLLFKTEQVLGGAQDFQIGIRDGMLRTSLQPPRHLPQRVLSFLDV